MVGILQIPQLDACIQFPAFPGRGIVQPQLGLLFYRPQIQCQILRPAIIIVPILEVTVIQIAVAKCHRLYMPSGIMTVHPSHRKGFLIDFRQIAQQVFSIFSFQAKIQFHTVDAAQSQYRQFIVGIETCLQLEGSICIGRQERKAQNLEQHLQVRLADRHQVRSLLSQMTVGSQSHLRCTQRSLH